MADLNTYRVVRRHEGDRVYEEKETRDAYAAEVKHLVPHVLELIGPAEKAEPAPLNKAEHAAPANKAITTPRKTKGS